MSREKAFDLMMETLFEMAKYISLYESTPRRYRMQELYMTEVHALNIIWKNESVNLTHIAQMTNRTKGAASQMITKLNKRGLVEKIINPQNKSEIFLTLTDEGKEICEYHKELEKRIYKLYLDGMDDYSEQDFLKYKEMLNRIKDLTVAKTTP